MYSINIPQRCTQSWDESCEFWISVPFKQTDREHDILLRCNKTNCHAEHQSTQVNQYTEIDDKSFDNFHTCNCCGEIDKTMRWSAIKTIVQDTPQKPSKRLNETGPTNWQSNVLTVELISPLNDGWYVWPACLFVLCAEKVIANCLILAYFK